MNKNEPININRHPLLKQMYEVCIGIEKLSASKNNTELSVKANGLLQSIWEALPESKFTCRYCGRRIPHDDYAHTPNCSYDNFLDNL